MKKHNKMWKKCTAAGMSVLLAASGLLTACGTSGQRADKRIVVFNYGDYIDHDVLKEFEKETGISVAYEEFLTPEAMYTKYKNGTIHYDLICCSDYMLDKMIREKDVRKIDMDQLEYAGNIGETYWKLSQNFDPDNSYSVPYFWGTVGGRICGEKITGTISLCRTASGTALYRHCASLVIPLIPQIKSS